MAKSVTELSIQPLKLFESQVKQELQSTFFFAQINNYAFTFLVPLFLFRNPETENLELAFICSSDKSYCDFKFELLAISESVKVTRDQDRTPSEIIDKILDNLNIDLIDEILKKHLDNRMLMKWQNSFMRMLVAKKKYSFSQEEK